MHHARSNYRVVLKMSPFGAQQLQGLLNKAENLALFVGRSKVRWPS